ncbi:glyoxalase [Paenibacillus albicereus]|uniref:Glyoxalase n=2 Tax=Paenibacillus albicereus TaxID=2726185 RepID=A0A6H2H582_9BACL|nr:glyoxalase [Paenibacillus albicereus]
MIPQRVSLITLGAYELPKLRRFYRSLGWEELPVSSDAYAVFRTAGVLLSLYPAAELARDAGIQLPEQPGAYRPVTLAVNVDRREEVDAALQAVRQAGAEVLREPCDAVWGGRIAYFADPERNVWEIAWNPTAVFDERGGMISF